MLRHVWRRLNAVRLGGGISRAAEVWRARSFFHSHVRNRSNGLTKVCAHEARRSGRFFWAYVCARAFAIWLPHNGGGSNALEARRFKTRFDVHALRAWWPTNLVAASATLQKCGRWMACRTRVAARHQPLHAVGPLKAKQRNASLRRGFCRLGALEHARRWTARNCRGTAFRCVKAPHKLVQALHAVLVHMPPRSQFGKLFCREDAVVHEVTHVLQPQLAPGSASDELEPPRGCLGPAISHHSAQPVEDETLWRQTVLQPVRREVRDHLRFLIPDAKLSEYRVGHIRHDPLRPRLGLHLQRSRRHRDVIDDSLISHRLHHSPRQPLVMRVAVHDDAFTVPETRHNRPCGRCRKPRRQRSRAHFSFWFCGHCQSPLERQHRPRIASPCVHGRWWHPPRTYTRRGQAHERRRRWPNRRGHGWRPPRWLGAATLLKNIDDDANS
mmetsp:Transcript_34153/g.94152  ORF Transcript_34153/g.94152 Transcript_34153/m.94152 type:complete len:441 (+) Transcript_34153:188-1510(+)